MSDKFRPTPDDLKPSICVSCKYSEWHTHSNGDTSYENLMCMWYPRAGREHVPMWLDRYIDALTRIRGYYVVPHERKDHKPIQCPVYEAKQ